MNKKKIIIGSSIAAVVVVGLLVFPKFSSPDKAPVQYQYENIKRGDLQRTVTATGTVEPIQNVEVGTQVSGIISKIYVDYNSVVKRGQVLAEIDRTTLESELKSNLSSLNSSKTEYEYQKKNFDRTAGLYKKELVSQKDYETAEYQYITAKSAYERAQASLVKAQTNLNYATITSPIDGVVLNRAVDEGQTVAASFSTPTLFTIANNLKDMQVIANVDEADIGDVEEGQRVTFTVDAYPEDVFEGKVTQVRLQATTTSNVVTYEVVINAPNPELKLKPGLTANITIITAESKNALSVPTKAFKFKPVAPSTDDAAMPSSMPAGAMPSQAAMKQAPAGAMPTLANSKTKEVWVKDGKGLKPVKVETGITDGIRTEIVSGLKDGDVVAISVMQGFSMPNMGMSSQSGGSPFMPKRPGKN